jgi:protein-disulfide isomerase
MENRIMNDEQWVNRRMQALDTETEWRPNAAAALAGLRRRDGRRRTWRRGWIWSAAMTSACAVVLLGLPSPAKCALVGVGCRGAVPASVLLAPAVATKAAGEPAKYKESGSPTAPVVLEIYSDYECPACAYFYTNTFPDFVAEYVKTGKVRIVHRDFPLPQHPYARLAARYANAAGELGHYDEVAMQLFSHQPEWAANGNVDASVAQVLAPGTMQQVRALVEKDPKLDDTVVSDLAIVTKEQIHQTPTLVFVYKGSRQTIDGPPTLTILKSFLDQLLKQTATTP